MLPDLSWGQGLALAGIAFALCLGALLLREILIDYAALKLREDALGYRADGDWPFVPSEDFEHRFHDDRNITGRQ